MKKWLTKFMQKVINEISREGTCWGGSKDTFFNGKCKGHVLYLMNILGPSLKQNCPETPQQNI